MNPAALAFAVSPDVALLLRRRETTTGSGIFIMQGDTILGRRAVVSNCMPATTCVYGDWSSIRVVDWRAVELIVVRNATAAEFKAGVQHVRASLIADVVVTHPTSFSVASSVT